MIKTKDQLKREESNLKEAIAEGRACVCVIKHHSGGRIVLEKLDGILAMLDGEKDTLRVEATIETDITYGDRSVVAVGSRVWWSPEYPDVFIEATDLDETARQCTARVLAWLAKYRMGVN